jgi:hypothetical protein
MRNDQRVSTYRGRAAQLRTEANALSDPETKQAVLEIAERYDRLANRIEAKDQS